jgi:hypothetical protein
VEEPCVTIEEPSVSVKDTPSTASYTWAAFKAWVCVSFNYKPAPH